MPNTINAKGNTEENSIRKTYLNFEDIDFPQFEMRDLYYQVAPSSDHTTNFSFWNMPDRKGVYNCQTHNIVNVVSDRYHLVNHEEVINDVEELIHESSLDLSGITRKIVFPKEGNVMFCTYDFPSIKKEMSDGDSSNLQITIINSSDSSLSFELVIGAVRMACENGQIALSKEASCKLKHFNNYFDKNLRQSAYTKALAYIDNSAKVYAEEVETWESMKEIHLTREDVTCKLFEACNYTLEESYHNNPAHENSSLKYDYTHNTTSKRVIGGSLPKAVKELSAIFKQYRDLDISNTTIPVDFFYGTQRLVSAWRLFNTLTHWSTHITRKNEDAVVNLQEKRREITRKIFNNINLLKVA